MAECLMPQMMSMTALELSEISAGTGSSFGAGTPEPTTALDKPNYENELAPQPMIVWEVTRLF